MMRAAKQNDPVKQSPKSSIPSSEQINTERKTGLDVAKLQTELTAKLAEKIDAIQAAIRIKDKDLNLTTAVTMNAGFLAEQEAQLSREERTPEQIVAEENRLRTKMMAEVNKKITFDPFFTETDQKVFLECLTPDKSTLDLSRFAANIAMIKMAVSFLSSNGIPNFKWNSSKLDRFDLRAFAGIKTLKRMAFPFCALRDQDVLEALGDNECVLVRLSGNRAISKTSGSFRPEQYQDQVESKIQGEIARELKFNACIAPADQEILQWCLSHSGTTLDFSPYEFSSFMLELARAFLSENPAVVNFEWRGVEIGKEDLMLLATVTTLEDLKLSGCELEHAVALEALGGNTALKSVILSRSRQILTPEALIVMNRQREVRISVSNAADSEDAANVAQQPARQPDYCYYAMT